MTNDLHGKNKKRFPKNRGKDHHYKERCNNLFYEGVKITALFSKIVYHMVQMIQPAFTLE